MSCKKGNPDAIPGQFAAGGGNLLQLPGDVQAALRREFLALVRNEAAILRPDAGQDGAGHRPIIGVGNRAALFAV